MEVSIVSFDRQAASALCKFKLDRLNSELVVDASLSLWDLVGFGFLVGYERELRSLPALSRSWTKGTNCVSATGVESANLPVAKS